MWFVSDTPAEHKRISREEKEYIMGLLANSTHDTKKKVNHYKHLFKIENGEGNMSKRQQPE